MPKGLVRYSQRRLCAVDCATHGAWVKKPMHKSSQKRLPQCISIRTPRYYITRQALISYHCLHKIIVCVSKRYIHLCSGWLMPDAMLQNKAAIGTRRCQV